MLRSPMAMAIGLACTLLSSVSASAIPMQQIINGPSITVPVAGGCGPNGWRGPWGHCRNTPYYGRLPGGYYQPQPHPVFGCPPGYWHGPWGHCRDTPYHGRLPDGGWK
jgi:hypothetical protein